MDADEKMWSSRAKPNNFQNSRTLALLLAILFIAFALRLFRVPELLMWGDEGFSVFSSSRDLLTITLDTTTIDPHPPLYYFLLHFYFPLAGQSELAIRFFSVFFGTATIAVAWLIGKRMFGVRAGILSALMAMLAPFAVHYSQEVRMYALAMFWVSLGLYFFIRLDTGLVSDEHRSRNDRVHWLGYALAMFLALYTLYHTALIFLAIGLVLLPQFKTRRVFVVKWFAVSFGIVATFLPWLAFRYTSAFTGIKDVAGETQPMDFLTYLARGFAAISVGTTIPIPIAFQLAGLLALIIVLALSVAWFKRATKFYDALLVSLTVVPIVAYYPLYLALPLYRGRLFALACIPLMLLIARSLNIFAQRSRLVAFPVALFIAGASVYSLNNYYFNYNRYSAVVEDYIPLIRQIEQRAQAGDVILFHAYWQQGYFLSHYHGAPLRYRALENQNDLNAAVDSARNVWAIVQGLSHHPAEDWLAQNAFALGEEKFGQMRLLAYRAGTPARGEIFATPIQLDNGTRLLGYHLNDTPIETGRGALMLQLDWQANADITIDYKISVRLTNPAGNLIWAQADDAPAKSTSTWRTGDTVRDYRAIAIPPGTPPGDYGVQVVVYDAQSNRVANVIAPENRRGAALMLGNVTIARGVPTSLTLPPDSTTARWDEISLVGVAGVPAEIDAGDNFTLTLYWLAQRKPTRNYRANLLVLDSAGGWRASNYWFRPASDALPTGEWSIGDVWLDKHSLTIAADASAGDATVWLWLQDEAEDKTLAVQTAAPTHDFDSKGALTPGNVRVQAVELARIKINTRVHHFDLPAPQFKTSATFGGNIKLLGYDLDAKKIKLTLYWQASTLIPKRLQVFVHLLDPHGDIAAQRDSEPQAGIAPTTSWLANEVIADVYTIDPPPAAGDYTLVVGMYDAATGGRLNIVETGADSLPLTPIHLAR